MLSPVTRHKRSFEGHSIFMDFISASTSLIDGNCEAGDQMCVTIALQLFETLVNKTIKQEENE